MLQTTLVGLGDLTYGSQYQCNSSYCWGLGGQDLIFTQLQHYANKLATAKGLPTVTVDGKIGPATAKLIGQIAATEPTILAFLGGMASQVSATPRQVASQADRIVQALLALPGMAPGTPAGPGTPTGTMPALPGATGTAVVTTTSPVPGIPGANVPVSTTGRKPGAASVADLLPSSLSPTTMLLLLAGGGLAAYLLLRKK